MLHQITILEALFLGLVQGFTEWLPVSSSGHLVIFQSLLNISVPSDFDIVIMAGTIVALILYFRKKILFICVGIITGEPTAINYAVLIILSGIPTCIIGFAGRQFFKSLFGQPVVVSILLVITGIFLFIASWPWKKNQTEQITTKSALLIGIAQGIAVAPGISRSGATIGTAVILGIKPRDAAEFSFLIGIPAMTVAAVLTFLEEPASGTGYAPLVVAIIAAFIAGYASIGIFMKIFEENRLYYFAPYCILAGTTFAVLAHVAGY
jgi:undecaprenyl-diphosphatase